MLHIMIFILFKGHVTKHVVSRHLFEGHVFDNLHLDYVILKVVTIEIFRLISHQVLDLELNLLVVDSPFL